jgi:hypothetical protein
VADDRKPDIKSTFEELYCAKKLPPKQRRVKQSVFQQIDEAFEEAAAIQESQGDNFWEHTPDATVED